MQRNSCLNSYIALKGAVARGVDAGTGPEDRIARALALVAFGVERKIHHKDGVLFYNADEQNDSDDRNDR